MYNQLITEVEAFETTKELATFLQKDIKELGIDVLLTFQGSTKFYNSNPKKYKSYVWLKGKIGYYPIWTMKCPKDVSVNDLNLIIQSTLSFGQPYIYLIDPSNLETLDTYLYSWCDIHSIENFGCEEDGDEEVKERYEKDWKKFLLSENYPGEIQVQTLVREIPKGNILKIYKQVFKGIDKDIKTKRLNLFK